MCPLYIWTTINASVYLDIGDMVSTVKKLRWFEVMERGFIPNRPKFTRKLQIGRLLSSLPPWIPSAYLKRPFHLTESSMPLPVKQPPYLSRSSMLPPIKQQSYLSWSSMPLSDSKWIFLQLLILYIFSQASMWF